MRSGYALRNGIPVINLFKTAPIERIEVVRGATGPLYGVTEPGGIRNMVSKRPKTKPYFKARAMLDTFGAETYEFDARGPLIPSGKLSYRLAGIYVEAARQYDYRRRTDRLIYPALQWKPTRHTTIFLEHDYQTYEADASAGFPIVRVATPGGNKNWPATPQNLGYDLGYDFNLSGPGTWQRQTPRLTNLIADQKISDHWDFRGMYSWQLYDQEQHQLPQNSFMSYNSRTYRIQPQFQTNRWRQEFARADMLGYFKGKSHINRVLIGGDYTWRLSESNSLWRAATPYTVSVDDYNNPTYENGLLYDFTGFREKNPLFRDNRGWDIFSGAYVIDQLSFNKSRTFVLGGLRYDWIKTKTKILNTPADSVKTSRASPQIGISHRLTGAVSVYASYSTSVYPNVSPSHNPDGTTLDAQFGEGYDIGMKFEFPDRKLTGSLGYYLIYKKNLPVEDPAREDDADGTWYILVGKARSQGAEFSMAWHPSDNMIITTAYTYVDTQDDETKKPLVNTTRHNGNVWVRYKFTRTFLKGLSAGLGYRYRSKIYKDITGQRIVEYNPSASIMDMMLSWPLRLGRSKVTFQVNMKNLFNQEHIYDMVNGHPYDTGRSCVFSLSYQY